MKKNGLYLASLCLSIVFLTSCMKGSNVWEGIVLGVVDTSEKNFTTPVIKTSFYGDLYSSTLVTLVNDGSFFYGDCGIFYISINSDLPENSSAAVNTYGYQTVSILNQGKIPKYNLQYSLTDTSTILQNEVAIVKAYVEGNIDYIAGNVFFGHVVNIPDDWALSWDLSHNSYTMMPTIEGNNRYYDLYLRAIVSKEGSKTTKTDTGFTNAYFLRTFLMNAANAERTYLGTSYSATSSKFIVRINFPLSINKDTNTITWSSNLIENIFLVSSFLD